MLDDGFRGRLRVQLFGVVLIVNIVANADKFSIIVAACKEDDGNTEDFGSRDALQIGWVGLEDEFVHAYRDGAHEERVELLIVLGSSCKSADHA